MAQLIVLEMAIEGGLGDFRLLRLVGQAGEQAHLLEGQPALTQGFQDGRMDGREGLQALDLQLGIPQGGGDRPGLHLGLAQLADGGDHVGDMHRGVLGCWQHDAGRLLGLGLGQEAVDLVVVGQVAPVAE